jgi:peroxiredoxin
VENGLILKVIIKDKSMSDRAGFVIFVLLFCVLSIQGCKQHKELYARSVLSEEAPEFVVEKWLTDKPEMKGKYRLIEFWVTWCPGCQQSLYRLNRLHEKFGSDLVVIGISNQTEEKLRELDTELVKYDDIKFFLAIDTQSRMMKELQVRGVPHAIMVDPGGIVVWEGHPLQKGYELTEEIVAKILNPGGLSGQTILEDRLVMEMYTRSPASPTYGL